MTRLQFWIFTISCLAVAALVAADLVLTSQGHVLSHELAVLEQAIPEGERAYQMSQQVATQVYQLSAHDPALRQLMVREQIIVQNTPPSTPKNPAPAPAPTASAPRSADKSHGHS